MVSFYGEALTIQIVLELFHSGDRRQQPQFTRQFFLFFDREWSQSGHLSARPATCGRLHRGRHWIVERPTSPQHRAPSHAFRVHGPFEDCKPVIAVGRASSTRLDAKADIMFGAPSPFGATAATTPSFGAAFGAAPQQSPGFGGAFGAAATPSSFSAKPAASPFAAAPAPGAFGAPPAPAFSFQQKVR